MFAKISTGIPCIRQRDSTTTTTTTTENIYPRSILYRQERLAHKQLLLKRREDWVGSRCITYIHNTTHTHTNTPKQRAYTFMQHTMEIHIYIEGGKDRLRNSGPMTQGYHPSHWQRSKRKKKKKKRLSFCAAPVFRVGLFLLNNNSYLPM